MKRKNIIIKKTILYICLAIIGIIFISPLLWVVSTAFKTVEETYGSQITWIPNPVTFKHFIKLFTEYPFFIFIKNSIFVTFFSVIGTVISCSMVAYAFARLNWFGKNIFFIVLLATMMIPQQVTMIPLFILFNKIGWVNTFKPLIIPQFFAGGVEGALYVFILRQFIRSIPRELDEAAKIDGCGYFKIYTHIIMPLLKPALGTVAVFSFMLHWNEFMMPLIYLNDESKFTLPVGLQYFKLQDFILYNELMSSSLLALLPCIIIFFMCQKYFIRGIDLKAGKG